MFYFRPCIAKIPRKAQRDPPYHWLQHASGGEPSGRAAAAGARLAAGRLGRGGAFTGGARQARAAGCCGGLQQRRRHTA